MSIWIHADTETHIEKRSDAEALLWTVAHRTSRNGRGDEHQQDDEPDVFCSMNQLYDGGTVVLTGPCSYESVIKFG